MRTEVSRMNVDADLVAQLVGAGERLAGSVDEQIRRRGRALIPALIEVIEDEALAREEASGGGYAPIHAARILGELTANEAIEPMLRVLSRCDPMDILYSAIIHALESLGAPVVEPALAAHAVAESDEPRRAIANVLSGLGVRDARILPILIETLDDDVMLGAGLLAEYGDAAALPHLGAVLNGCEPDARGGLFANQEIIELEGAIEELGGALTEEQKGKVRIVKAARDEARAPLLALGTSEGDDGEDDVDHDLEREREEVIGRFADSPHAESVPDLGWIDRSLSHAAEYDGISFQAFDAQALRRVVFELFPRKVSCAASAAPEIVRSLRAFWTFARDVLGHPHAKPCLAELGDEAIPRLARRLEDPAYFGMAKSFVMMGRSRGFRVESEEGLREWSEVYTAEQAAARALRVQPSPRNEDAKRKKKLRKLRKQVRRRNRR
jgi:hypothetical protein